MAEIPNTMLESPSSVTGQLFVKLQDLGEYFTSNMVDLLWNLMIVVAVLLVAKFVLFLVSLGTKSAMSKQKYHASEQQGRRFDTMMTLLRSTARYAVYFCAILLILKEFNLFEDMKGLVVTAGIGSLAIGFGAQNLVRDVVTGMFMMFENQFSVGDYIKTEEAEGTVEATAMRVTYLRTFKGEQVIIPNGSITRVVNYSRGDNVAVITICTNYEADTRQVIEIIEHAVKQYAKDNTDIVKEEPVIQGITGFSSSSVDIGVICKVQTMKQWQVERGMRLAIKEMFEQCGVKFPYPRVITVPNVPYSTPHKPAEGKADQHNKTEKAIPEWANMEDD